MGITCQGIGLDYATRTGPLRALDGVDLDLADNQIVCLVGPSGCGKSSLLKIMAGLIEPTEGRLAVDLEPHPDRLERALVFQDHCVFPWMSVLDNVAFGLEWSQRSKPEKLGLARRFIEQVGLVDFAGSYPRELSVGMRQRVSLARAFVAEPQILLMDEPFASLDALTKLVLQEELLRIWENHRSLIVYVTHDLAEAILLGDRVLVMSGRPGVILEDLSIDLRRPRNLSDRRRPEIAEIEQHLWSVLEKDVRRILERSDNGSAPAP
ncbi:MAG: ABC transporter ATP-binding protein [Thermoanaerobaculia bacterium]|nr:ABC transporter ATP-binding protein [Thermoanaerobaculia bacterium]